MSRIVGLNDNKGKKDDKKNEYFAGGIDGRGGGSGLSVEGPPQGGRGSDPFDAIVRQAQSAERPPLEPGSAPSGNAIVIALYRNGFVVNDGPLRDLTSPESKAFLADLERGELPAELRTGRPDKVVDVQLNDKRQEDFIPPAYVAYSGSGARIGSTAASDAFEFSEDILSGVPPTTADDSKPCTTIQIKTHDGKKLRLKINQDNTVLQLAAHIHRSGGSTRLFSLNTGFPPKDVVDPMQTIAEAGMIGASITQKKI